MYVTYKDFDYIKFMEIPEQRRNRGNQASSQRYYYKDIITAFDIETTYIKEIDESVMYIWQWHFDGFPTVIGRTWYELMQFIKKLEEYLEDQRLIVFVHNLSFEFQYISGIFDFDVDDVFAIDRRKVLKALLHNKIEFRCSYLQTNMSLRSFCEKMGVKNYKLKMNYDKPRFWYTELTQKEMAYCLNDVRGLVEAIKIEMDRDGDNLYTLPLTSTGYARRDAKAAMRTISKTYIQNQVPSFEVYELLREAFRGGNTHASRYYSGKIVQNVKSADISSCYPDSLCNDKYPVSRFIIKKDCTLEELHDLIFVKEKATLIRCSLVDVKLKDDLIPVPYLPTSKCKGISGGVYDNGRVLSAEVIAQTTFTDIDYKIMLEQYDFKIRLITVAVARYGMLPDPLRKCILSYYINKTDLKDKESDAEHSAAFYELLYHKSKNLLNSQYGMMAQNPVKVSIKYVNEHDDLFMEDPDADPRALLETHNKRAFLVYQWGVWCTAHCREHLQRGINACGLGFIYCDTDSCKYIGDVDWKKINAEYIKRAKQHKTYATDPAGKVHYMGLFEIEEPMKAFKTMGAKKYAYIDMDDKLHITIAGVNKKIGAIELARAGGLSAMQEGFVFRYGGGLEARYSDIPKTKEFTTKDGVPIRITRNVSLVPNTKTLGLTAEYRSLLEQCSSMTLDI